jgi:hypothetical protein
MWRSLEAFAEEKAAAAVPDVDSKWGEATQEQEFEVDDVRNRLLVFQEAKGHNIKDMYRCEYAGNPLIVGSYN